MTSDAAVLVEGRGPWFEGMAARIEPGGIVVVGRSRTCHFSLRKSRPFREHPDKDAVLRSRVGIRPPATAAAIEDIAGPARARLSVSPLWWWYVLIGAVACAIAWVAGGR